MLGDTGLRARDGRDARPAPPLPRRSGRSSMNILVFDMDGVLVDVSESYRETIQQTVAHFTGRRVTRAAIQDWKNRGGWNDDWALSAAMIRDAGIEVDYDTVVKHFQAIFHGNGADGLI